MIEKFFDNLFNGELDKEYVKERLEEMHRKGESVEDVVAAVRAMRERMVKINVNLRYNEVLLDIVGTGGDGKRSLNISTISAIVAAGAGCRVAKHCNRSASGGSGSVDLLEKLGVNLGLTAEQDKKVLEELGICFLYARKYHPVLEKLAEVRKEIGHATIFNLAGPLINPVSPGTMLVGAYNLRVTRVLAQASAELKVRRAMVFHNQEGYDEITLSGMVISYDVRDGRLGDERGLLPRDYAEPINGDLKINSAEESAEICKKILYNRPLSGNERAMKEAIILNAGFGIYVNGKATSVDEGVELARKSINEGKAGQKLEKLIEETNRK